VELKLRRVHGTRSGGNRLDLPKSIPLRARYWRTTFQECRILGMSLSSENGQMDLLTSSSAVPLVSHFPSPVSAKEWMILVATSSLPILELLIVIGPSGWFTRMSPDSCRLTEEKILEPSLGVWQNSGSGSATKFWTLSTPEWNHTLVPFRSAGGVCSLSDVLEAGSVPQRYYLSARACSGILRRAEKRGKSLPQALESALMAVAQSLDADDQLKNADGAELITSDGELPVT
jgi:hypothetical protein